MVTQRNHRCPRCAGSGPQTPAPLHGSPTGTDHTLARIQQQGRRLGKHHHPRAGILQKRHAAQAPTQLLSLSYEPIKYQYVPGKWNDEQEAFEAGTYKAVGKQSLPYLVNSTNYGTLDTAWTAFLQKLEDVIAEYAI